MVKESRMRRLTPIYVVALVSILGLVAFAVSSAAAPLAACTTSSVLSGSRFEIDTDANFTKDGTTGDCIDWLNDAGSALRTGVLAKPDKPTGASDDSFGKGTAEDNPNPTIVDGSIPPNKSDLLSFGVFKETAATAKFLELYWTRINSPQGTTNMDFELNQKSCPPDCADNGTDFPAETPVRTAGDKLITYDLSKGGTVPTISIRSWSGSAWGSPTCLAAPTGTTCSGSGQALGAVNTSTIAQANSGSGSAQDPYTFGEAAINFSAIFPPGTACTTFGSAYLKSRSSDSFSSEIKDFISPEPVQITNCSSITTNATASVTLGSPISDTATLSGVTANAGGTITFHLFNAAGCAAASEVSTGLAAKTVSGPNDYNSGNFTPTATGTYYWTAVYSGDLNNSGSSTACGDANESSVVNKAQLTVTTQVHDAAHANQLGSAVSLGSIMHDFATLSGTVSGVTPANSITFTFYNAADCPASSGSSVASAGAEGSGVRSVATTALAAGSYSYKASIAGDSNYLGDDSDCENFTVNKAQLTASTEVHNSAHVNKLNSSVPIGSVMHDFATVSGAVSGFTPSGTVSFTFYSAENCGGTGASVTNAGAEGAGVRSADSAALSAGKYSYKASVAGDSNYLGDDSDCENFTVDKATPGLSTAPSVLPNDRATISGLFGASPGGTLTFKAFENATCTGIEVYSQVVNVTGNANYDTTNTGAYKVSSDKIVRWTVDYSGDANNNTATSDCAAEPVKIDIAPLAP